MNFLSEPRNYFILLNEDICIPYNVSVAYIIFTKIEREKFDFFCCQIDLYLIQSS